MAERKLLKRDSGGIAEFSSTDTIPAANLPAVSVISPAQIASNQDNYNPTGWADADVIRLDFDSGGRGITGFTAWTNGRQKQLRNMSANYGFISCEHPSSTASNRVIGVCDHIIPPYGVLTIEYDSASSRIRVVDNSFNPSVHSASFYQACPGATLGSDWGSIGFGISSGDNGSFPGTSTLPGAWEIHTSTSAAGASSLYFTKSVVNYMHTSAGHQIATALIYLTNLSDGTNTYTFSFGLATANSTTLDTSNEATIRYSHGLNSGKWLGVSRSSGSQATVDLGVTVATNTLYALTICMDDAASEVRFYVNGTFAGRTTTQIPSTNLGVRAIIVKSVGTTQRSAFICAMTALNMK